MGRDLISDDELARAKALIETDELAALQRVSERADRLSMYATLLDDPDEINGSSSDTSPSRATMSGRPALRSWSPTIVSC